MDIHRHRAQKQANKKRGKGVKVVYISSPMKVTASASQFRALVQELTGQDSDVAGFMEASNPNNVNADATTTAYHASRGYVYEESITRAGIGQVAPQNRPAAYCGESPETSDSLPEQVGDDDGFVGQIEENLAALFPDSVFHEYYYSQPGLINYFDAA